MKPSTKHMVLSFGFYGMLGWIIETAFIYFTLHKYVERGWIQYGLPLIPLYGVCCPVLIKLLTPQKDRFLRIFIYSACIVTVIEYIIGYVLTFKFHYDFWNYSNLPFSYRGIIALPVSLSWGFLSLLMIHWIDPSLRKLIDRIPAATAAVLSWCLAVYSVVCSVMFLDKYFF